MNPATQAIADRVIDQCFRSGLQSLDAKDQVFFLIWCHAGLLDNGGHASFFYNSGANYHEETITALQTAGLSENGDLLRCAASALFTGDVPREINERNSKMLDPDRDDGGVYELVDSLDRAFDANGGGDHELEVLERWYANA